MTQCPPFLLGDPFEFGALVCTGAALLLLDGGLVVGVQEDEGGGLRPDPSPLLPLVKFLRERLADAFEPKFARRRLDVNFFLLHGSLSHGVADLF